MSMMWVAFFSAASLLISASNFANGFLLEPQYIDFIHHDLLRDSPENPFGSPNTGTDEFDCPLFKSEVATDSIYSLTPYDVKVVAAMGDSLTAAFGAEAGCITEFIEYRGQSWSIGGDETLSEKTTFPNIIKMYNSQVKGFSIGNLRAFDMTTSNLNRAMSGSTAKYMPSQAAFLVDKILNNPEINNNEDWKVVTIFIGGNNLCKFCTTTEATENENSPEKYIEYIEQALDILFEWLPRTFVNLVIPFDVTIMEKGINGIRDPLMKGYCGIIHDRYCPCDTDKSGLTSQAAAKYKEEIMHLIDSEKYYTDNFTVVAQPMYTDLEVPFVDANTDLSFFAPDCFHFSGKGHHQAAIALWNNMMQPIGEKSTSLSYPGKILCPTKDSPHFKTHKDVAGSGVCKLNSPC